MLELLEQRSLLSVTLNFTAASFSKADGTTPLPLGSTFALIADRDRDGFGDLTQATTSFLADADDLVMAIGATDDIGGDVPGSIQQAIQLNLAGTLDTGDPLLLVWYDLPFNSSLPSQGPGNGVRFGTYRNAVEVDGSIAWVLPSDGATVDLIFLTASNGGSNPDSAGTATFTTGGGAANTAPDLADIANTSVNEGQSLTIPLSATDAEGNTITFSVQGLPSFGTLVDNGNGTGSLQFNPGFSDAGTFNITVAATDNGVPSLGDSESFTLTVNNVNRAPTLTAIASQSLDEGDSLTVNITANDPDGANTIVLTAPGLPAFATLTDNGDGTGVIQIEPGFEDAGSFNIAVLATDSGGLTDTESFTLTVNDVAQIIRIVVPDDVVQSLPGQSVTRTLDVTLEMPGFTQGVGGYSAGVLISPAAGGITLVGAVEGDNALFPGRMPTVSAVADPTGIGVSDQLSANQEVPAINGKVLFRLQYTIAAGVQGQFTISLDPALFELTDGQANNITNVILDAGVISVEQAQAPVLGDAAFTLEENSAPGAVVGVVNATDGNTGDHVTFSIIAGNTSDAFAINPATGEITVASALPLNFETQPTFTLTVRGQDSTGLTDDATITINLSNVNEAPTAVNISGNTVAENDAGAIIGALSVLDPDSGDTHTFAVSDSRFEIVAGSLKLKDAVSLDFEQASQVNLNVTVTDAGGLQFVQPLIVQVTDVFEIATATIVENQVSVIEGDPGQDRRLIFTLTLSAAQAQDAVVHVSTTALSANAAVDFIAIDTDVVFTPGQTSRTVEVLVVEDLIDEIDETFALSLTGVSGNVQASDQAVGAILDDEAQAIVVSQLATDVPEGGSAVVTVGLLFESSFDVTISIVKEPGGDADLAAAPGQFVFLAGSTGAQSLTFTAADDADSSRGSAVFTLSAPTLADVQIVATETDNDAQLSLAVLDAAAAETNNGQPTNTGVFRITRSGSLDEALTIDFMLSGQATNGVDYAQVSTTLVIPANEASVDVVIAPINDTQSEIDETVVLTITPSQDFAIVGAASGTVTIADNDPVEVGILAPDAQMTEGTPTVDTGTIRVFRTGSTAAALSVNIARGGTALFGAPGSNLGDYSLTGGINTAGTVVMIPAGASFVDVTATPRDDTSPESTETVLITLAAGAGYSLPAADQRSVTLQLADDEPQVRVEVIDGAADESGDLATLRIHRTGATTSALTVNFAIAATPVPGAQRGLDFLVQTSGTTITANSVAIFAGQSFVDLVIVPLDDTLVELTENLKVTLAAGTTYSLAPDAADRSGTVAITDNEPQVRIEAIDAAADEGGGAAAFRIHRTQAATAPLTVNFSVATFPAPAAGRGVDYVLQMGGTTFTTNQVTVNAGESFVDVIAVPIEDTRAEVTENISLTLTAGSTYGLDPDAADRSATATLTDNEPVVSIAMVDAEAAESGTPAVNTATYRISRLSAAGDLTVNFTRSGTAQFSVTPNAGDYVLSGATLNVGATSVTIPDGQLSTDITLTPREDTLPELTETAILTLSPLATYTVDPANRAAVGTILDNEVRTIEINDMVLTEGQAGFFNVIFTLRLSSPSSETVTVVASTANETATAGSDYDAASRTVVFNPGQVTRVFSTHVNGDRIDEENETFVVNLTNPTNAVVAGNGMGVGRVTIVDNDAPPQIRINDVTVTENGSGTVDATFALTLSAASQKVVSVQAATGVAPGAVGFQATASTDFTSLPLTTFTFNPGQTSIPVTVTTLPDDFAELAERFAVNLSSATNATIFDGQGVGTIQDDDGPTIDISDAQLVEPDAGVAGMAFTVTLSKAVNLPVSVRVSTSTPIGSTVSAGDFIALNQSLLTFNPGETSRIVEVPIRGDTLDEDDETFIVTISSPSLGALDDAQATGTILDNDPLPTLSINDVTMSEGDTGVRSFAFTVQLSRASGRDVNVTVGTTDDTATAGDDYTALSATGLTFTPGQLSKSITVAVTGDLTPENTERFFVDLTNPQNAAITSGRGIGTITSDEFALNAIAGLTLAATVTSATGGLPAAGTFQIDFAIDGTYTLTGDGVNTPNSTGTFTYLRTGKNTGRIDLVDNPGGAQFILLTFTSVAETSFVRTRGVATQRGTIVVV